MTRWPVAALLALGLFASRGPASAEPAPEPTLERALPLETIRSGQSFQSPDTQALQNDAFANPGTLWVDRGAELFRSPVALPDRACADCHDAESLTGAAARYPAIDGTSGALVNLEQRVNLCRVRQQGEAVFPYESEDLLAVTAYVASLSRGMPFDATIDGPARSHFEAGRRYFFARKGQMNLSCHQCHNQNAGRMLRGDRISQGHGNGYPAYRFEWDAVGSLHRRFRACDIGVRAEPFAYGSPDYVDLELYLAWRAGSLPIETPAVRR